MAEIKNKAKIDWLRVGLCAAALCALAVIFLGFYEGQGAEIIADLSSDDKNPHLLWLAEHLFAGIPVLVMVIVAELFYINKKNCFPVYTQMEKLMAFGAVAAFIYLVMLPFAFFTAGSGEELLADEAVKSYWDKTYKWFFAQIIPLLIVISYHAIRMNSEKAEINAPSVDEDEDAEDAEDEEDE